MVICVILVLHAVHTSSGNFDLLHAHCTHQISVLSVACNKLELSGNHCRNVKRNGTRQNLNEIENIFFFRRGN